MTNHYYIVPIPMEKNAIVWIEGIASCTLHKAYWNTFQQIKHTWLFTYI